MNVYSANGRPTQFHAVPEEERALDENGKRLPWSLEWPDDHPNARGQKRRPVESGPFGRSLGRSKGGSLRSTRTATPKKESSNIDGFTKGLENDKLQAETSNEVNDDPSARVTVQQDNTPAAAPKEPVQVMLYGFSPETQWAAISFYEKASGGMICEDYERNPPNELRRISATFSSPGQGLRRPLTPSERKLSLRYRGGHSWIKVTFDSVEAAEQACQSSPHLIQGHWIYADHYVDGIIPNNDEPIPLRPEDRLGNLSTAAMPSRPPSHKTSQSFGPASSRNLQSHLLGANSSLSESFGSQNPPISARLQPPDGESESPATASSATATAPENGNLHRRDTRTRLQSTNHGTPHPSDNNTKNMKFFPNTPRTILRPESEAFLPQPSWAQKTYTYLEKHNVLPRDIIGHVMPRTENGEFDLANASFYWRICYWIDCFFGTDICGFKEE